MRKLLIALVAAIGFIFGSWSGRTPYETLRRQVAKLRTSADRYGPGGLDAQGPTGNEAVRARVDGPSAGSASSSQSWPSHAAV
jgi:hypothetical protein